MDEGLAALVAGLAGALGAAAGAYFTGRAMIAQTRNQASIEHGHWVREQRRVAYSTFLSAWDGCDEALLALRARPRAPSDSAARERDVAILEATLNVEDGVLNALATTVRAMEDISLLGPPSVDAAATHMCHVLAGRIEQVRIRLNLTEGPPTEAEFAAITTSAARLPFLTAARQALGRPPRYDEGSGLG
ncbi:hypothetical protein ACFV3E_24680 [Streptomyces sp. NPDC059718]